MNESIAEQNERRKNADIERLTSQAVAYAWGYTDASASYDGVDAVKFATAYETHLRTSWPSRTSLQDAYAQYAETGAITR